MAVFFRILSRLAVVGAIGAILRGRRGAGGPWRSPGPPWRTPGTPPPPGPRGTDPAVLRERGLRLARGAVEGARLAGRVIALVAFALAFAAFTAAGTTLTSLGPRWVGIALLVCAVVALLLALVEARAVWRIRRDQVLRRRANRLRRSDG